METENAEFCRLVFLRHPELEPSHAGVAVGDGAAPVGRRGQAQILKWLERLEQVPVDSVFSAEQPQCCDAAQAFADFKRLELVTDGRLNDQGMGSWQGRSWQDIVQTDGAAVEKFFGNLGEVSPPGGESQGQAIERMIEWWQSVAQQGLGKTLVVVAAGPMIAGFATAMLGMRLSRCMSLSLPSGGVGALDCFGNGVRIHSWNPGGL